MYVVHVSNGHVILVFSSEVTQPVIRVIVILHWLSYLTYKHENYPHTGLL